MLSSGGSSSAADIMRQQAGYIIWGLCAALLFSLLPDRTMGCAAADRKVSSSPASFRPVQLIQEHDRVIVDNGFSRVTLTIPGGIIAVISYGGIDNLLYENSNGHAYWDANWKRPEQNDRFTSLSGTTFRVIKQTPDQVELSFSAKSLDNYDQLPFDFDKRFVMIRGVSGFYEYATFERPQGSPDLDLYQTRTVFKLNPEKFEYMALSDKRRRIMPTADDRASGKQLAYPEAVLLTNPSKSILRGKVDDKYQYSAENKDINVHGWISMEPGVGFWVITPSHESVGCGPVKQELTSHVGPTSLAMFMSTHYAGEEVTGVFRNGEPWKKVFGPIFIYLNSNPNLDPTNALWDDAKRQMSEEVGKWPYDFPMSQDFQQSNQRATVSGQLQVHDSFIHRGEAIAASNAYIGLAPPGMDIGSWQRETKGYQFWIQADPLGKFSIPNVISGNYTFNAWVPGFIGEFTSSRAITIPPGAKVDLGIIRFEPPRDGPTLWEIGIPDRTAAEFLIPDPEPNLTSGLYALNDFDKFREYGLWDRYSVLYPNEDLTFTAGVSKYQKDWFYAHVARKGPGDTFLATTWKILFTLPTIISPDAIYKLRIAIASATYSELQVRINEPDIRRRPHFTTGLFGRDNAIARHGIHGLYWLYDVDVHGGKLVQGNNTIYLTQTRTQGPFHGLMYDYIRMEGPVPEDDQI